MVEVDREGVTQPGKSLSSSLGILLRHLAGYVQMFEGEGMPLFEQSGHGDLFIEYNVVLPVELSSDMRQSEPRLCVSKECVTYPFAPQNSGKFSPGLQTTRETSYKA